MKDILKEKCRGKVFKGVSYLHDNAPAHQALGTQKKLTYLGFQCLDHPPYSPDLAPSDYHLFPGLKRDWKVAIFCPTRRPLLPWRPGWTDNFLNFLFSGLQKLEQRAKKCTEFHADYFEQIASLVAVACFLPDRAKDLSAPPQTMIQNIQILVIHAILLSAAENWGTSHTISNGCES